MYQVRLTPVALKMLKAITDRRVREKIRVRIDGLASEPEKQGKALLWELAAYRSIRAAGRYRIIYRVEEDKVLVLVVALGIRKEASKDDVYALARKLIRLGLLDRD